jgi:hypothetical protein
VKALADTVENQAALHEQRDQYSTQATVSLIRDLEQQIKRVEYKVHEEALRGNLTFDAQLLSERLRGVEGEIMRWRDLASKLDSIEHQINILKNSARPQSLRLERSEATTSVDLSTLIQVYDKLRGNDRYASVAEVAHSLVQMNVAQTSKDALELIDRAARLYPEIIQLGRVSGKSGNQLTILTEKLR